MLFLVVLAVTTLAATAAFAEGSAPAAAAPAPAKPVPVQFQIAGDPQQDGSVTVSAKVTKADGKAVGNLPVYFYVVADFFGQQSIPIGSVATDSAGIAAVSYKPSWDGATKFMVVTPDTAQFATSQGTADLTLKSTVAPYKSAPPPLVSLRRTTGLSALTLTGAVWLLLIFVAVRAAVGISRGKADEQSSPVANAAD